ncbi:MAG: Inner membrane ABC transporter permease protein YdcU [Anaerolineae bacterium]|nr:Inner membrane ABC transporter permease protein YdcU [Anaerolineae bacterium]
MQTTKPSSVPTESKPANSLWQRLSTYLYLRPRLLLALLLGPPLVAFVLFYIGSLAALLVQSFFSLDSFTGLVVKEFTLDTYRQLFTPANMDIVVRTVTMAAVVTLTTAILAFPVAYYSVRFAPPRLRPWLYLAVLLPLWSSYLVRVYAWRLILAKEGIISWVSNLAGLNWLLDGLLSLPVIGGPSLTVSWLGMYVVFVYVWLPYMVLPVYAALERVPTSLLEASSDLGGRPGHTFRWVTLPLAFPGVVAGSIFTFSLTLGDFIVPSALGNSSFFIGQAVLSHQGTSGNVPLAAAFTMIPIVIMALYLTVARKLGAFDAL